MDLEELSSTLSSIEGEYRERSAAVASLHDLETLRSEFVSKKGKVALVYRQLGAMPAEMRPKAGELINALRERVEADIAAAAPALEEAARLERLAATAGDPSALVAGVRRGAGRLHLVTRTRIQLEDIFVGMGFTVEEGPEVESEWYNFEALNIPKYHPARDGQDSFYLNLGEEDSMVLRTHTSPVQVRVMQNRELPIYAIMPGRVFRRDTADARHTVGFHQIEGLVVDKGITFGHLAGTIENFTREYFGPDITSRLRPAYFPFTEPSAEFEITCTICKGSGCRTCSHTGWIELGGCGMVHPNVFEAVGVDSEEYSGFAFGFGIDRLAQMRWEIPDMRVLTENDIRYLSSV